MSAGTTVSSRYEILEKVGAGGFGVVYKARDLHVPRLIALKFIYPHLLESREAVIRFRAEANAVSVLTHPNIVVLHDFDTDTATGSLFLALEYLGGGTLRQHLDRIGQAGEHFPLADLLRCGIAIAAGLGHAHRHGIVHRDVKSSNVLFSEDRLVKITDFGLAKSDGGAAVTMAGCALGTVAYMSPEQARGLEVDHRTDIYALGVVLYEMAAGRLPFTASSPYEVARKIAEEEAPPLRQLRADVPDELERIIRRATAKQAAGRYPSMEELEKDLTALERRIGALSEQPTATLSLPARRPRPRSRLAAPALLLMLAAAVSGTFWWRARRPPPFVPAATASLMAVVPFHCLGADESRRSFCEGLAHTLSTKFTQMETLQNRVLVVPYADVRSEGVSSAADAHRLFKARLALTGSVEFLGESVRIIVNLVDAEKTVQMLSRKLDSSGGSLARLQDQASDLAGSMLEVQLTPPSRQQVNAGQTRNEAAFGSFLRGLGDLDNSEDVARAIAPLEEAVRIDPSYALAHAWLGEAYVRAYDSTEDSRWIERARASCQRALRIDSRLAQAHITMAKVWLARTAPDMAIEALRPALNLEPRNADALRTLGNAYAELGRRDPARKQQAIETFRQAIALRPELWTTYRDLGLAYHNMGDNEKAEQQFLLMLKFTGSADAYRRVGALYHLMNRTDDAIAYLQKSLAIQPTPKAYANLGTVYYYLRRYRDVVPNFENALRLSAQLRTRSHVIWGNLASAYMRTPGMERKGRETFREAIRIAEEKLRASPADAATHASLAYYMVRVGDNRGALRHAERATELAPEVAGILFRCGVVYEHLHRRGQALDFMQRAIGRGHPLQEVLNAEDLAALRQDPRFSTLVPK